MLDQMFRINQFAGLNTSVDKSEIDDFELSDIQNFYQNTSTHELVKREPFVNIAPGSAWPTGVLPFFGVLYTATTNILLGVDSSSNRINSMVRPGGATATSNAVAAYGTITAGVQYNDKFYFLCPTGIIEATAGAITGGGFAGVVGAGTPGCTTGCIFKERLFVVTTGNTVAYSDIGAPLTFGGASFFEVAKGDGQTIVGIIPLMGDKLLVFKQKSIYILYVTGTSTASWYVKLLHQSYGCISYNSLRAFEGLIYFVSSVGICRTDGVEVQFISDKIDIQPPGAVFPISTYLSGAHGGIVNRHYIVSSDARGIIFAYNVDLSTWTIWDIPTQASQVGFFIDSDSQGVLSDGVYCVETGGSIGVNERFIGNYRPIAITGGAAGIDTISSYFVTKYYDMGSPDFFKRWKYMDVQVVGEGTFTLTTYTPDGTASMPQTGVIINADAAKVKIIRFKIVRMTKALAFKIEHTDYRVPVKILSLNIAINQKSLTPKANSNA